MGNIDHDEQRPADMDSDPRSNDELIEALRTLSDDSDEAQVVYTELEYRWSPQLLDRIREISLSPSPEARIFGLRIVRAMCEDRCHLLREECIDLIVDRRFNDDDDDVADKAFLALDAVLVDYRDSCLTSGLMRWADHPNPHLRLAVVWGFMHREDSYAIGAIIRLSDDPDMDVRNWATYGLSYNDVDSPEIRESLFRRVDDNEAEIRAEALLGLALRDDERVVGPLVRELGVIADVGEYRDPVVEAAMISGDPRLYPHLMSIEGSRRESPYFDEAIAACRLPDLDEVGDEPDDAVTTCPVCGLKDAFPQADEGFCVRCGWRNDSGQRAEPDDDDGWNHRSLNQERARWLSRVEQAKQRR